MTFTCPQGHPSTTDDWCDVCGAPMGAGAAGGGPAPAPPGSPPAPGSAPALPAAPAVPAGPRPCPSCGVEGPADALFCEACGYDFTTGSLPPAPAPAADPADALVIDPPSTTPAGPAEWVAEVWVDPDWYAVQDSDEACPSAGAPVVVPLPGPSMLIGRRSASRGIHPEVECGADTGVSRRHAQLTTDGRRWWVEDLRSANGTYVGGADGVPEDPLVPGQRRELAEDERIYLGAWTRIVVRPATPGERGA